MTSSRLKQAGFTMVELMLAMAFIAFLLLFVVSAILQITKLYSKGLAIRQINQTGGQVVESLTKAVRYSKPVYVAASNRLCVDGTSYVWNVQGQPVVNKFTDATNVGFVAADDMSGSLCAPPYPSVQRNFARDLVGPEITPMKFTVAQNGSIWDISLVLATSGSNLPTVAGTPSGFECSPQNEFCAFGDFTTSVYSRGR